MNRARTLARLALVAPLLTLAACGGDDDDATPSATAAPSAPGGATATTDAALVAYCDVATQMAEQNSPPTLEQIQAYAAAAPQDIATPASVVRAAFEEADGDIEAVFRDQAAIDAFATLTAFEAEACGLAPPVDAATTQIDPDATRVDVAAADYSFAADYPSTGGRYSFVMTNDGAEPHLMILVHLEDGMDIAEVMASEGETGVIAMFESDVAAPGGEVVVTVDLEPGQWAIVCPIPDGAGVSHAEHGMVHELTIT